jgi:tetratricopeptide (TPR) repeat protein
VPSGGESGATPDDEPAGVLDDVERALLAQLHFSAGAWREGLELVRTAGSDLRGLRLLEARALFALGEQDAALELLRDPLTLEPDNGLALFYQAQFLSQLGRGPEAASAFRALVGRQPDFPGALQGLATLMFPGPPYREVLRRIHDILRPRTYLEIGVEHGTTLALAVHSQQVVGIDPVPRPPTRELPPCTRLYHTTSDAFFAQHSRDQIFGADAVEFAFIDGMHLFEYALRDFCNAERWCAPTSTVVLHDCLPVAGIAASRERRTTFWVGDTWKALECLLRERPDLRISIVPCHPSGLVVVQNLDPASSVLSSRLEALSARYLPLEYPSEPGVLPGHYPIVPNTEAQLARVLGVSGADAAARGRSR